VLGASMIMENRERSTGVATRKKLFGTLYKKKKAGFFDF